MRLYDRIYQLIIKTVRICGRKYDCSDYMRFIFRTFLFFLQIFFFGYEPVFGSGAFIEPGKLDGADVADALGCYIIRYDVKLPAMPEDDPVAGYKGGFWTEEYTTGKENPSIIGKDPFGFGKGGDSSFIIKFPDWHSPLFTITVKNSKGVLTRSIGKNPAGIRADAEPSSWAFLEEREEIVFNHDIILAIRTEGWCKSTPNVSRLPDILRIYLGSEFHRILVFKCRIEEIRPLKKSR